MKLAFWATNTSVCGEATALHRWWKLLSEDGAHECTLFTTTKSGRRTQMIAADFPYQILKDSDSAEFVSQFDMVVFYGAGSFYENVEEVPIYMEACHRARKPYVMTCASAPSLQASPWNFARMHYARGLYFLRESLRNLTYLRYPFLIDKPSLVVKHPVKVPDDVRLSSGTSLLFTSRMEPSKRLPTLLESEDPLAPWPLEIWSSPEGRHGFRYTQEYGDRLLKRLKGGYTSAQLDDVYRNGRWMVDLTAFKGEPGGGIQNTGIEALLRGVPVITASGWSPWDVRHELPVDLSNREAVRSCIDEALNSSDEYRETVLQSGLTYLRAHHGQDQVVRFKSWLESLA